MEKGLFARISVLIVTSILFMFSAVSVQAQNKDLEVTFSAGGTGYSSLRGLGEIPFKGNAGFNFGLVGRYTLSSGLFFSAEMYGARMSTAEKIVKSEKTGLSYKQEAERNDYGILAGAGYKFYRGNIVDVYASLSAGIGMVEGSLGYALPAKKGKGATPVVSDNLKYTSAVISPKVGVDFHVTKNFSIGASYALHAVLGDALLHNGCINFTYRLPR